MGKKKERTDKNEKPPVVLVFVRNGLVEDVMASPKVRVFVYDFDTRDWIQNVAECLPFLSPNMKKALMEKLVGMTEETK